MDAKTPFGPGPLAGKTRFLLSSRRRGSWERYQVVDQASGALLLIVTRYGHFWQNLAAGVAGVACGLAFAFLVGARAWAAEGEAIQAALAFVAVLGGVVVVFLVDIALSPRRDIRAHVPGGDRRAFFRLLEDNKINLHAASYTLWDQERRPVARVRKNYLRNLPGKRWECRVPLEVGGETVSCSLREDSLARSLLRRLLGGAFGLFATDYVFESGGEAGGGAEVGRLRRRGPWRARFLLEVAPTARGGPEPWLAVAMAVLADSIEWR